MSQKRYGPLPDVPTMEEVGVSGMHISFWHGLWAPKGTPKDAVAKINAAVVAAFNDPAVRKRIGDLGQTIPPPEQLTPAALGVYHKSEIDKWWPLIKSANIKVN
jgi:tripartite-type tricarboxylate transporter receptor subunit TctC